jgi:AcrR family transcriptional regulator
MSSTLRRSRRARGAIGREQILTAAVSLLDRHGPDGFTMRALAEELHCGTMTLYTHVAGRDDLLAGVIAVVIDGLDLRSVPGEIWQDCARRTVASYRALAYEHPGAFELLAFADNDVDPVATYFERLLWLFQEAGLSEAAARTFLSVADGFASGFLLYECRSLIQRRKDAAFTREQRHEASHLADLHAREAFDTGFDVVIRGIEAMFPEAAAPAAAARRGSEKPPAT